MAGDLYDLHDVGLLYVQLTCRAMEKIDDRWMAGKDQDLIGFGELREGNGGAKRAVRIEVDQDLVHDDGERLRPLPQFPDQPETERQEQLLPGAPG